MTEKIFIIDATKCVACHVCFIACKDEFVDHPWLPYSEAQPDDGPAWISIDEVERGQFPKVKVCYVPQLCMQCESAPCIRASKNGAVYRRDDGIVVIDPQKSKGQTQIAKACPYGSISWNKALDIPQKCTWCVHLLDQGWKEPRCVEVCPTEALRFGERSEFAEIITKVEELHPEYKRKPLIYYIGIPKKFVAGTVFCTESSDCIEKAKVSLIQVPDGKTLTTETNNYGDFEFDGLEAGLTHSIKIEAKGYYPVTIENVCTSKDVYLKDILLRRKVS